jgi:hypothetical protein
MIGLSERKRQQMKKKEMNGWHPESEWYTISIEIKPNLRNFYDIQNLRRQAASTDIKENNTK